LDEIDGTYKTIAGLGQKLKSLHQENSRHSQLAAAVDNLMNIFNVPETISRCEELINDGKLLHAHKCLSELECSRNDLLYELHKQPTQTPTDRDLVMKYFADMDRPLELLSKQLWLILHRTIISVRMEPTIIVTVLRIIEREERTDALMAKQYEQMRLPDRPKRWKQKAFDVMNEAVHTRIEGNQMEDRTMNKMWLVRHLEVTRQLVLEDLRVVKTLCEPCFPPHYNIVQSYINMYHNNISLHLSDIIQQGLEGNEIVSLLTWINDYQGCELMGHPDLKIDVSQMSPLLDKRQAAALHDQYIRNLQSNFREWLGNCLKTDAKDWMKDEAPDADDKGYYNTALPVIVIQMFEQNLQVASTIGQNLVERVVAVCIEQLIDFAQTYRHELAVYKEQHLLDRSKPSRFVHFMIANINNCQTFVDLANHLNNKYASESSVDARRVQVINDRFHSFAKDSLAMYLCDCLLEEVFMDIDKHIQELITKKWLGNSNAVDTICITVEDYCQDFIHLRDQYYDQLLQRAQLRIAREYYKALFTVKRIAFKNYEERSNAAEQIHKEADQLAKHFKSLIRKPTVSSPFEALEVLSEIIKLKDTSMLSLEITGFGNKYPDIKIDQLVNLLLMRGDIGRTEARQLVVDCLTEDHDVKNQPNKTVFTQLALG
jgi:exocyst complex component 3